MATATDCPGRILGQSAKEKIVDTIGVSLPSEIVVGGSASEKLGEVAQSIGLERVLIVTDPFMFENGPVERLAQNLKDVEIGADVYSDVQPDPTIENVDGAIAMLREHGANGVVAIGGGSSLDAGKAAAVMAANEGSISEYQGYDKFYRAGLPLIAIPTTAGTGSEVTRGIVITDTQRDIKMMMLDSNLLPRAALADYQLTMTMPPDLTAYVGVDSLTHAIEAYVSKRANMLSDMWALQSLRLIGQNLRTAYKEPDNEPAREAMMLGSTLAGMAFSNASVALVHGMSRPIGAHFHLPHGLSNAVLLPTVTRFSLEGSLTRYATIAREIGVANSDSSCEAAAERLVEELEALNRDLGIPLLRELGVEWEHFESVLEPMSKAALDSGSPSFNPREPSAQEIVALYREIY